jgi:drug/metabolite transporter (DMT)-like permease
MATHSSAQYRMGLIFVAMAALAWSQSGVFTRLISADLMTMLFWRGIFSGIAAFTFHCLIEKRIAFSDFKAMGLPGLGVCCLSALAMGAGIGSLRLGGIADSMVIYATAPFLAAGLAYVLFRENTSRATLIASVVALVGVVVMLAGSDWNGSLIGKALSIIMTLSMAGFSVLMREHKHLPMLPALAASAWLVTLVTFPFAHPLSVTSQDLLLIVMFGVLQNAAGLALYSLGTKRIPAAESTLLAALEVPLAPLWVWFFLNETPPTWTLIGGAIVLVALFGHILGEFRRGGEKSKQKLSIAS